MIGDRMQILVDGELINTIYSNRIQQPTTVKVPIKATSRDLILLVENMGRVGFIHLDQQRKGG
uniref:Beta-galactosidase 1-like first all-beta domain-containing protein n=1 Tax=Romanomermis culicivorax TaxID=13658 RepID=A0A915KSJ2_ROMCU